MPEQAFLVDVHGEFAPPYALLPLPASTATAMLARMDAWHRIRGEPELKGLGMGTFYDATDIYYLDSLPRGLDDAAESASEHGYWPLHGGPAGAALTPITAFEQHMARTEGHSMRLDEEEVEFRAYPKHVDERFHTSCLPRRLFELVAGDTWVTAAVMEEEIL